MFFPLNLIISFVHILNDILSPGARNLFWQLFKAENPSQFRDMKAEIKRKYPDLYHNLIESKEYNLFTPFFNHGQVTNGLKASSLAESINALLLPYKTKEPIEIFLKLMTILNVLICFCCNRNAHRIFRKEKTISTKNCGI